MSEPKIYIKGQFKKGTYGVRLSFNAEKLIEQIKANTNEKGYFNVELNERKDGADQYGNTHYMTLNTWKPDPSKKSETLNAVPMIGNASNDDLPF